MCSTSPLSASPNSIALGARLASAHPHASAPSPSNSLGSECGSSGTSLPNTSRWTIRSNPQQNVPVLS